MFLDASTWQALAIIGTVGALGGLLGGLAAGADSLIGTLLIGIIGGIALSAIVRFSNGPSIYAVGDDFSVVWGGAGGLLLGFVVGRSNV
jgi:hypothetical protein